MSANSTSFGYDTNGNEISKSDASGSWTYTWDYENRLKQTNLSGLTVSYSYDALGRRIERSSSIGGTEKFIYDGADVVRDLDASGSTLADYWNGPGIDNKLRQTIGTTTSYFLTDHLGTTRELTNPSGSVASSLSYDSFGNVISASAATRYTYTGREADVDTNLMYYRARWYDQLLGRFISEDPIGLEGGLNLFTYVTNNSVSFTDPSGLCPPDAECDRLRGSIFHKAALLLNELRKYDPVADGRGGPTWKPGGHFIEINDLKTGIKNDIKDYIEKCIKKGGDPPAPPIPRWIDEAANRPVPIPVLPPGVLLPGPPVRIGPRPVPVPVPALPTFLTIPLIMIDPCLVYPKLCFDPGT